MEWGLIALGVVAAVAVVGSYLDTKARVARIERMRHVRQQHDQRQDCGGSIPSHRDFLLRDAAKGIKFWNGGEIRRVVTCSI